MKIPGIRQALIVVAAFAALSAIGGGLGLIFTNGMGIPLAYLRLTPFSSYVIPGLILGIVVGGSSLAATLLLLGHRRWAYQSAFVAGAIMTGWIIAEVVLIRQISWLQVIYLIVGVALMDLVIGRELQSRRQSHTPVPHAAAR